MYKSKINLVILLIMFSITMIGQNKKSAAKSSDQICPILVGEKIPSASLKSVNNNEVNLIKLISKKPTLLIFYRGGWCPYCNLHLSELQNIEKDLIGLGYQIIAVSMDKPEKLAEAKREKGFNYTLLSDNEAEAALAFGLAFKVDDETIERYKKYEIDLEASSGKDHHILPVPAAFIIDTDGVIQFSYVNPNYKVRVNGELLLAAAKTALKK